MGYDSALRHRGQVFPREVEIRLENITGYGRSCQTALDFVLRNDALD